MRRLSILVFLSAALFARAQIECTIGYIAAGENPFPTTTQSRVTLPNVMDIFSTSPFPGEKGAKAVAYLGPDGKTRVAFWPGRYAEAHHPEVLEMLHREAIENLRSQLEAATSDADKARLQTELSAAEKYAPSSDGVALDKRLADRGEGFEFTGVTGADGKFRVKSFKIESRITNVRKAEPQNGEALAKLIVEVHNSIDPTLRDYQNIVKIPESTKFSDGRRFYEVLAAAGMAVRRY